MHMPVFAREKRQPPPNWTEYRRSIRHRWTIPFHGVEWGLQWVAYLLGKWAFLEVLDYLGALSLLVGLVFYWSEAGTRLKLKHYQAWQVVNTAQGKGGSGGRIEALQELNADNVPLVGVDVSGAFLQGVKLPKARAARGDFEGVDARNGDFSYSDLSYADLKSANFRHATLDHANLRSADLEGADLVGASLIAVNFTGANLKGADLRNCDLQGIEWKGIMAITAANLHGVRNAPEGFLPWARDHGATNVDPGTDTD